MTTRIVLVDDHQLFREGIRNLLNQQLDLEVIGECDNGRAAVDKVRQLSPQVVIMDLTMPHLNGIDATRRIVGNTPGVKVIALSMHGDRPLVQEMLRAGASGYLLKECVFQDVVRAIQVVNDNKIFLSPEISKVVLEEYLNPTPEKDGGDLTLLTPREREVLQLIAEGNTNEEAGNILHMSRRTVEKHRARIMQTLKINSLAELVKFAIREGLTKL